MGFLTLNGREYKIGIKKISRNFTVEDGENTMLAKSGRNVRDIVGTRYNYTMEIESRLSNPADYDAFYEAISAPVQSNTIKVPYAQGTLTFEADVESGSDTLLTPTAVRKWGNLKITFTAKEPQRKG